MTSLAGRAQSNRSSDGDPTTEQRRAPLAALLASVVLVGYLLLECLHTFGVALGVFDEPIELVNALNVIAGRWPHVGFVTTYPPLHYYALALSLQTFGVSIIAARLVQIVFLGAVTVSLLIYMRRGWVPWSIAILSTVLALAAGQFAEYPQYAPFALSFVGLVCYLLGRREMRDHRGLIVLSGALTGLSFVGRINFGAYIAGAIWLTYLIDLILDWRRGERERARSLLTDAALFTAAFVGAVLVYLLPYGSRMGEVLHQIIGIPPKLMAGVMFAAPVGSIHAPRSMLSVRTFSILAFTAFPLVWAAVQVGSRRGARWLLLAAVAAVAIAVVLGQTAPALLWIGIVPVTLVLVAVQLTTPIESRDFTILIAFTFYLHYFLNRPDSLHMFLQTAIGALLLPVARQEVALPATRRAGLLSFVTLGVVTAPVMLLHLYLMAASGALPGAVRLLRSAPLLLGAGDARALQSGAVPPAVTAVLDPDADEVRAAQYVVAHTAPTDAVYVGLRDHSRAFINDIRLYWFLDRPIGSRHILLMNGLITTAQAQAEVREDLERRRVSWVVLWDGYPEAELDRTAQPRGSTLLDDYIRTAYLPRARFGAFTIMERGGAGPSTTAIPGAVPGSTLR